MLKKIKQYLKSNATNVYNFTKYIQKSTYNFFYDSSAFWKHRYDTGGNSGAGSYGEKALEKAEVVNKYLHLNNVDRVIEWGTGDGNQLSLYELENKSYTGYEVSELKINDLRIKFSQKNFTFSNISDYDGEKFDLALSIEVIFHLDKRNFKSYMQRLFESSSNLVIIFSTNYESKPEWHMIHHEIKNYVSDNFPGVELLEEIQPKLFQNVIIERSTTFFVYKKVL